MRDKTVMLPIIDYRILQSILTDGRYEISEEDCAALKSVISVLSGTDRYMYYTSLFSILTIMKQTFRRDNGSQDNQLSTVTADTQTTDEPHSTIEEQINSDTFSSTAQQTRDDPSYSTAQQTRDD